MAAICPSCNKDMAGRGQFISGCCGRTCCAECMLIAEVTTCKETMDEQDEWHYVPEPFICEKKDGVTCDQITWVREIIRARNAYIERTRLIKLEHEQRELELAEARARETPEERAQREAQEKADKLESIRLTRIRLQASSNMDWNSIVNNVLAP